MESNIVLKCENITKRYQSQIVLNNFNMTINQGDIYGFVGENGSGKTTIIRIISGLVKPNSGSFFLFGIDSKDKEILKVKNKLGAIVETPALYPQMTLKDNMKMVGMIVGNNDIEEHRKLIDLVGLSNVFDSKKKVANFSLGMRQRLGIAIALLSNPEFIMLDEPMNGLDPEGIVGIRNLIINLNQTKGITFLISSHILSELSLVATKYGIISHGVMLKEITKEELNESVKPEIIIDVDDVDKAYDILSSKYETIKLKNSVKVIGKYELNEILKLIQDNGLLIMGVNQKEGNIEDYYLSIIGGNRHD